MSVKRDIFLVESPVCLFLEKIYTHVYDKIVNRIEADKELEYTWRS